MPVQIRRAAQLISEPAGTFVFGRLIFNLFVLVWCFFFIGWSFLQLVSHLCSSRYGFVTAPWTVSQYRTLLSGQDWLLNGKQKIHTKPGSRWIRWWWWISTTQWWMMMDFDHSMTHKETSPPSVLTGYSRQMCDHAACNHCLVEANGSKVHRKPRGFFLMTHHTGGYKC